MADLLSTGTAWLSSRLTASAATPGVYRRKSTGEFASLSFTLGRSNREQNSDRGLINVVGSDDVLVGTADFEGAFGADVRPEDGDTVELNGRSLRVRPLGAEPCWRKSDPAGHRLRIHVKDYGSDEGAL